MRQAHNKMVRIHKYPRLTHHFLESEGQPVRKPGIGPERVIKFFDILGKNK